MSDMIASARNMTVVAEGQYNTVGLPKGGFSPATLTAMTGFSQGQGLNVHTSVTEAIAKLRGVGAATGDVTLGSYADSVADDLERVSGNLMLGGPSGFVQKLNSIRGHLADSIELRKSTDFLANVSYSSFGSGITDINSLSTRGIDNVMGNLPDVGACLSSTGSLFDTTNMSNFGTSAGLVEKLNATKMGNATGVNAAIQKVGLDLSTLSDRANAGLLDKAMEGIDDPKVLNAVAEQFDVDPFAGLPAYTGKDSSLNSTPTFLTGGTPTVGSGNFTARAPSSFGAPATNTATPATTTGTSKQGGSFGSNQIEGQTGTGLQGLQDFQTGNYDTSGLTEDQAKLDNFLKGGGLDGAFSKLNSGGQ